MKLLKEHGKVKSAHRLQQEPSRIKPELSV